VSRGVGYGRRVPSRQPRFRCSLLSFAYLVMRRVLALIMLLGRSREAKEIEVLVLRHQVEVLHRLYPRPRFEPADRAWLAALSRLLPRRRWSQVFLVRPETVLRWHSRHVARRWTYPNEPKGRPPIPDELAQLIVRLASENPTWGYERVRGELLGLGHRVAGSTIHKVLRQHHLDPAPRRASRTWRAFLCQQAASIVACDFFAVDTISVRRLYVLFFIHHQSRRVFVAGVTTNPTRAWVTQPARNVSGKLAEVGLRARFVIRDRDGKFGPEFDTVWGADGAAVVRTPVQAPNANAITERFVRTVRAECTDRLLIINNWHLRRVLDRYVRHYNEHRPHRSLHHHPPQARFHHGLGASEVITRRSVLGGLINEYSKAA